MTVTTDPTTVPRPDRGADPVRRTVWKTGSVAGVAAAAATLTFAALAQAIGVPLKVSGASIPLLGFAQLTLVASIIGIALAAVFSRRAARPKPVFVYTTIALTLASIVPDALAAADTATKFALALSHLVAAAIVIPALASRLCD